METAGKRRSLLKRIRYFLFSCPYLPPLHRRRRHHHHHHHHRLRHHHRHRLPLRHHRRHRLPLPLHQNQNHLKRKLNLKGIIFELHENFIKKSRNSDVAQRIIFRFCQKGVKLCSI